MLQTVLKPFPYAHDGNISVELAAGDEVEIRDELVAGLAAAGFVGDPAPLAPPAPAKGRATSVNSPAAAPIDPAPAETPAPAPSDPPAPVADGE